MKEAYKQSLEEVYAIRPQPIRPIHPHPVVGTTAVNDSMKKCIPASLNILLKSLMNNMNKSRPNMLHNF